jgi:hypothetical protein
MSDCCDIPKAGAEFVSDEIILFGIELTSIAGANPNDQPKLKTRKVRKEDNKRAARPGAGMEVDEAYGTLNVGATRELRLALHDRSDAGFEPATEPHAFVAAYGYAFEGHCYRFDKPKIFIVPYSGQAPLAVGCGFKEELGYRMWRLRALDQALELTATYDTLQKLALEASLPGRRAPNTYEANMQLAHRGGRLTS